MGLFAAGVGAHHAHPRDHAPATKAVAALALRESTFVRVEQHVAAGAVPVGFVGGVLWRGVGRGEAIEELAARLAFVLGFVAVETGFEATVFAGEDATVDPAVEGLEELRAAVHADGADFELFGVSGWNKSVILDSLLAAVGTRILPETRSLACELRDLLEVERGLAEHALDLVWFVLLDLEADVDLPALVARTFVLAMPTSAVLWGDSE